MTVVRRVAGRLPFRVPIAGVNRDRIFGVLDRLFKFTTKNDTVATPYGELRLDPSHEPERLLSYLYYNVFEYYRQSALGTYLKQVAQPGGVFVDVGANLGMFALVARSYGLETVVIEPEPRHAAFLSRNTAVFGKVISTALSDQAGSLPLYYDNGNAGATSLFACTSYHKGSEVPVTTLSDLAFAGSLGQPDRILIIKVDVEGFEAQVIRGMRGLLDCGVRPHIWCEVRGDRSGRNGGSFRQVRDVLAGYGYCMRRLRKGVELSTLETELAQLGVFDALFAPH